jgi:hypothetical protein
MDLSRGLGDVYKRQTQRQSSSMALASIVQEAKWNTRKKK